MIFLNFVYLLSLAVWIGAIVFFSFFAAPSIFKILDRKKAGDVVGLIFPRYYRLGYVCCTIAVMSLAFCLESIQDWRLVILAIMAVLTLSAGWGIGPKTRTIKSQINDSGGLENNPELKAKFDKLHSLSVRLNAATLILGLAALWLTSGDLKLQ